MLIVRSTASRVLPRTVQILSWPCTKEMLSTHRHWLSRESLLVLSLKVSSTFPKVYQSGLFCNLLNILWMVRILQQLRARLWTAYGSLQWRGKYLSAHYRL